MAKILSLKKLNIFFMLIFLQLGILCAFESFDETYSINITGSRGMVCPSDITNAYCTALNAIYFDNGLYGIKLSQWRHESQAQQVAGFIYSGMVNIIPHFTGDFLMVYKDGEYETTLNGLWIDKNHEFGELPQILSITENRIPHWFCKDTYRYVIELNDGTSWLTQPQSSRWEALWEIGSRTVKIGNSKHPCLINIDNVQKQDYWVIKKKNNSYLMDLERL
ncbi:hypothetical protein PHSC3_001499 [Chlamydiales bacterium STE3]|nr:hypothetical protein PHSC3_001499 [Chlamydiales bacterium STE3]